MTRFWIIMSALIAGCIATLIVLVLGVIAMRGEAAAEELPRGFGHDAFTHDWVDSDCCSSRDCEPIPIEAVTQTASGNYHVHYLSSDGYEIDQVFWANSARISRDRLGRPVACGIPPGAAGDGFTPKRKGNLRCLYVVIPS